MLVCVRGLEPGRGRSFERGEWKNKKRTAKNVLCNSLKSISVSSLPVQRIAFAELARISGLFFWQSDLSAKSSCHWSSFYSKFLVLFAVLGRAKVAGDDDMARRPGIYWISWHMTRVPTHWCGCGVCCCFWRVFATLHCQAMERRYRRLSDTPIPSVKSPLPVIVWMSKILLA